MVKILEKKIVYFKDIYKFTFRLLFHRISLFCLLMENAIKNKMIWSPKKVHEIGTKSWGKNSSCQEDIQIYSKPFFDRACSFRLNRKKRC